MSTSSSSAIPNNLNIYSRIALTLDGDIAADAGRLAGVVSRFESTCREPGFQVNASYMPPVMSHFARDAEPTDRWVGAVASGFLAADSGGLRAPGLHNLPWFRRPWPGRPRMPWTRLPWVRLPFIPRRNPVPGPGFQTSWLPIRPLPVSILPWWPPLPNPNVPTLAVTQWQWRRPPWLFVKTWIWLLLPIKIWKWLPWFPPIAPIFRPMPIVRPMPWPPRLWRPIVQWFPSLWRGGKTTDQTSSSGTPISRFGELNRQLEENRTSEQQETTEQQADDAEIPGAAEVQHPDASEQQSQSPSIEDIKIEIQGTSGRLPGDESCVAWAKYRVPTITGRTLPSAGGDGGAQNYRNKFEDTRQFGENNKWETVRPAISKGSILVWEAGKGGAHKTAGHVAVVEAVSEGGIYISDANWGDGVRFIAKEYLETHGIYLVPAHAL